MTTPAIPFVGLNHSPLNAAWVQALQLALPNERIVPLRAMSDAEKREATVAIVANPDPAELRELPQLLWVHSVWAGVERLVAGLENTDVKIVRLIDPRLADTMAEAVQAWTLYLHREMPAYARQQRQMIWQQRPYVGPQRKTVSLLGLGALGSVCARRLLDLRFNVCGWSREHKALTGVECYSGEAGLATMLARTDILILLLPLTPATRGMVDAGKLAQLPRGASLINFARGPIVVDSDLRAALDSGHLDHAVLDVFAAEPLPGDHWMWPHPGVTVLPHCSAPTEPESASRIVADNILRFRKTGLLPVCVDPTRGY